MSAASAKRLAQLVFSLGLSGVFVWLSLRGADLAAVATQLAGADLLWVGFSLATLAAIHVVRSERWRLLVRPVARLTFPEASRLAAVGFMALNILPLRLGEFARPLLLAHHARMSRAAALAGVVVERVVDGLSMGLVLVGLLWNLGDDLASPHVGRLRAGSVAVAGGFIALSGLLVAAVRHEALARRWLAVVVTRRAPGLGARLEEVRAAFTEGLGRTRDGRLSIGAMTLVYWWLAALGQWLLARAFGLPLTWLQSWTVLGLQVLGAFIPAGPGMVGTYQFLTRLAVSLFWSGPDALVKATAFAQASWLLAFVQQVGLGVWFVARGEVRMPGLWRSADDGAASTAAPLE
ncbi:MAG: hypothetical protein RL199_2356 [Pseudomonadota bacterium]|jgi:uncharacterized protein (TIRG00374 family)